MKYLLMSFDSEFTELSKTGELISIGICTQDFKHSFYAEISGNDTDNYSSWIKENVVTNLKFNDRKTFYSDKPVIDIVGQESNLVEMKDRFEIVSIVLSKWLDRVILENKADKILFISDVAHYDMLHMIDLLSNKRTAFDIHKKVLPYVLDINTLMCFNETKRELKVNTDIDSFDIGRTETVLALYPDINLNKNADHNALFDAYIIALLANTIIGTSGEDYND